MRSSERGIRDLLVVAVTLAWILKSPPRGRRVRGGAFELIARQCRQVAEADGATEARFEDAPGDSGPMVSKVGVLPKDSHFWWKEGVVFLGEGGGAEEANTQAR